MRPSHLAPLILAAAAMAQQPTVVPDAAALARAQASVVQQLGDELLRANRADLLATQQRLFAVAAASADAAVRYLLLQQAVAVAERAHAPAPACFALDALVRDFQVDGAALTLALLQRLQRDGACAPAAVALTAAWRAVSAAQRDDGGAMTALVDMALRSAQQSGDGWLLQATVCEQARLQQLHTGYRLWCRGDGERQRRRELFAALYLQPEFLASVRAAEFAPEFDTPLPEELGRPTLGELGAARVLSLTKRARSPSVQRSLQLLARELLSQRWPATEDKRALIADLAAVTTLLADRDGITRLHFAAPADLSQLVVTGNWRVDAGVLVGSSNGEPTLATHRYAFRQVRSVLIRGGIRSPAGRNFRLAVGDVKVIFNWEVRPENHLWYRGQVTTAGPLALQPGSEHKIALHQTSGGIVVTVDDQHWFTTPGSLAGTVTVYPALGSEIFVREILIDGELAADGPVAGPRDELQ